MCLTFSDSVREHPRDALHGLFAGSAAACESLLSASAPIDSTDRDGLTGEGSNRAPSNRVV